MKPTDKSPKNHPLDSSISWGDFFKDYFLPNGWMKLTNKSPKNHPLDSSISWGELKLSSNNFVQRIDETNG